MVASTSPARARFRGLAKVPSSRAAGPQADCYRDYRDVLDRKDIDASMAQIKQAETSLKRREALLFDIEKQVTDVQDQLVRLLSDSQTNLVDDYMPAGYQTVTWNGTDYAGHEVASGVYFYRLITEKNRISKKMMLLR